MTEMKFIIYWIIILIGNWIYLMILFIKPSYYLETVYVIWISENAPIFFFFNSIIIT